MRLLRITLALIATISILGIVDASNELDANMRGMGGLSYNAR